MGTRDILLEELHEAKAAKRLRDDFLGDFMAGKEAQIFEHIKNLPLGSTDQLIEAHHQLKSLNSLRMEIESVMNTGKLAEAGLQQLDTAENTTKM